MRSFLTLSENSENARFQLETIGRNCFENSGLEEITIPKSVRTIKDSAFKRCRHLRFVTFEEGSRLAHVGSNVLFSTLLREEVEFPNMAQTRGGEDTGSTYGDE